MIFIITGGKAVGKTTLVEKLSKELVNEDLKVGGVITKGQEERHFISIKDNKQIPFFNNKKNNNTKTVSVGKFLISTNALNFAKEAIKTSIYDEVIFIDEIGKLEANCEGLYTATKELIDKQTKSIFVLVIREDNMDQILHCLALDEKRVRIIKIIERPNKQLINRIKTDILKHHWNPS